ncbi:MAG TPA: hypothetical protein VGD05_11700 [Pyrinomonadaceae bacterium]|jgi:archaellum component FlaG (FlaF/FlaG flagellin family)
MEILIIGGILVALMAYVSTKIKKSAADAYERERIETEEFTIIKPENFISPTGESDEYVFTAYSKDFGRDEAEEFRQAKAELLVYANADFEEICRNAKQSAGKLVSEETGESGNGKICFFNVEETENETETEIVYKIAESVKHNKIYELKISVLSDFRETYSSAINELLQSFSVK